MMVANVALVYDGGQVIIPENMGTPRDDQMQGTALERLGEVACRICYDSLGRGRTSEELHNHIRDADNLSVYRHCNFTVIVGTEDVAGVVRACANRKGIWLEPRGFQSLEITINLQAIIEWERYTRGINDIYVTEKLGNLLKGYGNSLAPKIIDRPEDSPKFKSSKLKDEGLTENQAWVSLWMRGSRAFSMEQIRHAYPVSQRSTRYCDESESPYVMHPLIRDFLGDNDVSKDTREQIREDIKRSTTADRKTYYWMVKELESYGRRKGLETTAARKQARGAARGYLGNALETEMIFSAPISGWKDMLRQRLSPLADAEIMEYYVEVLDVLKNSRYGEMFHEHA